MRTILLDFPNKLPSGNEIDRMRNLKIVNKKRLRGKYESMMKLWGEIIFAELIGRKLMHQFKQEKMVTIHFHIERSGNKPLDESNAIHAIDKLIVDQLIKFKVLKDDSPKWVKYGEYSYKTGLPKGTGRTILLIEETGFNRVPKALEYLEGQHE